MDSRGPFCEPRLGRQRRRTCRLGLGKSKLQITAASSGKAQNMNTVAKLVEMSS
jgi:hypothetical protein